MAQEPMYNNAAHDEKTPKVTSQAYQHAPGARNTWTWGLFDCFSPLNTCCLATWCPCVLFGRTYARVHYFEQNPSGVNTMCLAFCGLMCCAISPPFQAINRMQTREKYGFEKDTLSDFAGAFCCACCQLIQEEKESVLRQTGTDLKTNAPYVPPANMTYP